VRPFCMIGPMMPGRMMVSDSMGFTRSGMRGNQPGDGPDSLQDARPCVPTGWRLSLLPTDISVIHPLAFPLRVGQWSGCRDARPCVPESWRSEKLIRITQLWESPIRSDRYAVRIIPHSEITLNGQSKGMIYLISILRYINSLTF
jgi:hypothetical protein